MKVASDRARSTLSNTTCRENPCTVRPNRSVQSLFWTVWFPEACFADLAAAAGASTLHYPHESSSAVAMKSLRCSCQDRRACAPVSRKAALQHSSRRQHTRLIGLRAAQKEDTSTGVVMVNQEPRNGNGNGSSNGQQGSAAGSSERQPLLPSIEPPPMWSDVTLYKVMLLLR